MVQNVSMTKIGSNEFWFGFAEPNRATNDMSWVVVYFSASYQRLKAHVFHLLGTIGHVAHGKSTVVKALSGVHTVRFKNELERNITIKLGYANAKIYRSFDKKCQRPVCYTSMGSSKEDTFMMNNFKYELVSMLLLSQFFASDEL